MNKKGYRLLLRSKNFSCKPLKELMFPIKTIFRMGSTTPSNKITKHKEFLEINSVEACRLSSNKIDMKIRFTRGKVKTAEWFLFKNKDSFKYYLNKYKTIIAKHKHSSKGKGIFLIKTMEEFDDFINNNNPKNFVFEKYYTYTKEYRVHVTKDGYFYTNRKMLKEDAKDRWHRHDNNSVWMLESNPLFDKPETWNDIVNDCVSALKSLGLTIAAFDIKVNKKGEWIILESNSAPAFGEITLKKYKEQLIKLVYENF